ncbi:flagellar transcriptional regulator FlhD [Cupriavidus numazuensis]|uniref:Flagellar transcriptional regulator FlhD n=1 Tax=Cupriavidus numazuensis TaxID=221992 RepID=A0ABN7QCI2_9BURK|nr:flagellar transcriptional regulator FlhD [Cupriavidus numazuensis]CAG2159844.1 Flagellar transcriptional regulator FlhD [Cupriavidus numazuensis]
MQGGVTLTDIQEFNLSYLLLAQKLAREDQLAAAYRLGINRDLLAILERLTTAQVLKIAASTEVICEFRIFEGRMLNNLLNGNGHRELQSAHLAILLGRQSAKTL